MAASPWAANRCRPTNASPRSKNTTAAGSRPRKSHNCARNARSKASRCTARSWTAPAGRRFPIDGQLLVSHQDALLLGGKVQAPPGYADHVVFLTRNSARAAAPRSASSLLRPGHHARRRRRAGLRPREMRSLRRLPLELRATAPGKPRAHEHRLPRRHRRAAFGGELTI